MLTERDEEFMKRISEAWDFIKGNGEFTPKDLDRWMNEMDSSMCRQVLKSIIQVAWDDYGGKNTGTAE